MQHRSMVGEELAISGYLHRPVPNRLIRQQPQSGKLAIIYPGYNYTCDLPLLYYSCCVLEATAHDVLLIDTLYRGINAFIIANDQERETWLAEDAVACFRAGLAAGAYDHLTLIGKSIGTIAMCHVLSEAAALPTRAVWLTPLLRNKYLAKAIVETPVPSLFVVGSADPAFDVTTMHRLVSATSGQAHLVDGADHSLEIPGNVLESLTILTGYIDVLMRFVG